MTAKCFKWHRLLRFAEAANNLCRVSWAKCASRGLTSVIAWLAAPTLPSMFSSSSINASTLSASDMHCWTRSSLTYLPPAGSVCMGISPSSLSMLSSGIRPCRQQEKQKSCLTESANIFPLLPSSNMEENVGKAFVSTWLSAWVMQNSGVSGGNNDVERADKSKGILLMRNDRRTIVVWGDSFRNIALARTSNEDVISSIHVVWISP